MDAEPWIEPQLWKRAVNIDIEGAIDGHLEDAERRFDAATRRLGQQPVMSPAQAVRAARMIQAARAFMIDAVVLLARQIEETARAVGETFAQYPTLPVSEEADRA